MCRVRSGRTTVPSGLGRPGVTSVGTVLVVTSSWHHPLASMGDSGIEAKRCISRAGAERMHDAVCQNQAATTTLVPRGGRVSLDNIPAPTRCAGPRGRRTVQSLCCGDMQTGQVSVWVPIVVGVIGLVGVVAGQLVNAWREDRRWKREQQREEIRWSREREKDTARLTHEDRIAWRDRRLTTYSDYLLAIDEILAIAVKWPIVVHVNEESGVEWERRWSERRAQARRLEQSVKLICHQLVRELIERDIITAVRKQLRDYLKPRRDGFDPDKAPHPPAAAIFPHRDELIEAMRAELGSQSARGQQTANHGD